MVVGERWPSKTNCTKLDKTLTNIVAPVIQMAGIPEHFCAQSFFGKRSNSALLVQIIILGSIMRAMGVQIGLSHFFVITSYYNIL